MLSFTLCKIKINFRISGRSPFEGTDPKTVLEKNKLNQIDFSLENFANLPPAGLEVLKMMLETNSIARVTASQALEH